MIERLNSHYSFTNPASVHDEEALTALELAGRTTAKVNQVVDSQNELVAIMEKEREEVIPETIENDIIEHIQGGTFDRQIDAHTIAVLQRVDEAEDHMASDYEQLEASLGSRLNNLLGQVTAGTSSMDAEVIDLRTSITGEQYASAGEAIRQQFKTLPVGRPSIVSDLNLDNYKTAGTFVFGTYEGITNAPVQVTTRGLTPRFLVVESFGNFQIAKDSGWIRQTLYTGRGEEAFQRYYIELWGIGWLDWVKIPTSTSNHVVLQSAGMDINKVIEAGEYTIGTSDHVNAPEALNGQGFTMQVLACGNAWMTQIAYPLFSGGMYIRHAQKTAGSINLADDVTAQWSEWLAMASTEDVQSLRDTLNERINALSETQLNHGYNIVNMGDSIFGNTDGETSITDRLAHLTGATVYNCAFGGCQMTDRPEAQWSPFSMVNLATAIASGDFSIQENALNTYSGYPSNFRKHLNTLKGIDFTSVDVVTIAYGTNDFTAGDGIANAENNVDINSLKGALRYSIETLCTAFPNIRILVCTPMWRCWFEGGVFQYDSDTYELGGQKLPDFAEAIKDVAKEYHIPVCDYYNEAGVNKFNWATYFTSADGTHPHADGRLLMAKKLASKIREL